METVPTVLPITVTAMADGTTATRTSMAASVVVTAVQTVVALWIDETHSEKGT